MQLYVDGEKTPIPAGTDGPEALMAWVGETLRQRGRTVQEVRADGAEVPPDQWGQLPQGVRTLEISSGTLERVGHELLQGLQEGLPLLQERAGEIARRLRLGEQSAETWTLVDRLLEELPWVVEGLQGLEAVYQAGFAWDLQDVVRESLAALQQRDLTQLADLLEYDLSDWLSTNLGRVQEVLARD